jgi:hypothetical protein
MKLRVPTVVRSAPKLPWIFLGAALAAYLPLYFHSRVLGMDWDYYNALSLVIRSAPLSYGVLPLHNPWANGGLDILANPQARVLSPMYLLDLMFSPNTANILSLVVYSFLGLFGMYRLLRLLKASTVSAIAVSIIFINGSFFGLHFAEGHIAYGSMQLFPWVAYFSLRILSSRGIAGLLFVLAVMLLDGGVYAFGYSCLVSLSIVLSHPDRWSPIVKRFYSKKSAPFFLLALFAFALLAAAKAIPSLYFYGDKNLGFSLSRVGLGDALRALFCPIQSPAMGIETLRHRFHEIGCYFGLLSLGLIVFGMLKSKALRTDHQRWMVLSFLWMWAAFYWPGSEWFWSLYTGVPVLQNLHISTRVLIISYFFYMIVLAQVLTHFSRKRWLLPLVTILLCESLFVRLYPVFDAFRYAHAPLEESRITQTRILETIKDGWRPPHYFTERGAAHTYDPVKPRATVKDSSRPDYMGESYMISGVGEFDVPFFIPGMIEIRYSNQTPLTVELNTHYLAGWEVEGGAGVAMASPSRLLRVQLPPGQGVAVVRYKPKYFSWALGCYLAGLLCWGTVFYVRVLPALRRRNQMRKARPTRNRDKTTPRRRKAA